MDCEIRLAGQHTDWPLHRLTIAQAHLFGGWLTDRNLAMSWWQLQKRSRIKSSILVFEWYQDWRKSLVIFDIRTEERDVWQIMIIPQHSRLGCHPSNQHWLQSVKLDSNHCNATPDMLKLSLSLFSSILWSSISETANRSRSDWMETAPWS